MSNLDRICGTLKGLINPAVPGKVETRLAAVLILVYGPEPTVIMTERPKTMNIHAGEISFPGGSWKCDDRDLLQTALRETGEEIGAKIARGDVVGQLKAVTTLNSGFTIFPFIAVQEEPPMINPNSEIASVLRIPLIPLLRTEEYDRDPEHRSILEMYTFKFENHLIWGASARMLHQIRTVLSASSLL